MSNYEKLLYLYSCALEDGDWETLSQIFAQAEKDPALMQALEQLAATQRAELALPRVTRKALPVVEKITSAQHKSMNGHIGATHRTPPYPQNTQLHSLRKVRMSILRIAVLITIVFGGVFSYFTYQDATDNTIQVTPLNAASRGLQTEREIITADNIDKLELIHHIDRPAPVLGAFWLNNDTQYGTYSTEVITIYSAETYAELSNFMPKMQIEQVVGNPTNQTIAILHRDQRNAYVTVYDLSTDAELYTISQRAEVEALQFSPNGQYFVTAPTASAQGDLSISVWNATDGSPYLVLHGLKDELSDIEFSPDSQYLAVSGLLDRPTHTLEPLGESNYGILMWDVTTGELLYQLVGFIVVSPVDEFNQPTDFAFTPDASAIVATQYGAWGHVWSLDLASKLPIDTSGELLLTRDYTQATASVELDTAMLNATILGFVDKAVIFVDSATGNQQIVALDNLELVHRLELEFGGSTRLRNNFPAADGKQVLILVNDALNVYDLAQEQVLHTQMITQPSLYKQMLAINEDDTRLAVFNFDHLEIIDLATNEVIASTPVDPNQIVNGLAFDPIQDTVIYFSMAFALPNGNPATGSTPFRWDWTTEIVRNIQSAGFVGPISATGEDETMYSMLVSGLYAWEIDGDAVSDIDRLNANVIVTPETEMVLSGNNLIYTLGTREFYVHNLATGEETTYQAHSDLIANMQISDDGSMLLTLDQSGNIYLWDTATFVPITNLTNIASYQPLWLDIAQDNQLVILGGADGWQFWDFENKEFLHEMPDMTNPFVLNGDGTLLITQQDNDILFWGVAAE